MAEHLIVAGALNMEQCEKTGCVGERCFPHCKFPSDGAVVDGPWYLQEPLYLRWKQWDCQSDCRYYCMLDREKEREALGNGPVKYHGKWPFKRVYGIQEPASVALSALNLAMQFHGWLSFFILLNYKLPLKPNKKAYYEYTCLWHIYGLLSMNSWFWSAVFHSRDVDLTEKLDYSSAVALLGFSLILAILRSFNVRVEAARVMCVLSWVLLNFSFGRYGLVSLVILLAGSCGQCVVGGGLAMLLEIYDFPPYEGFVDAHALWHATTIPLTYIWWSFIKDDAEFQTANLLKKDSILEWEVPEEH
ncbi:Post-GPI attachment to proteins factor 3 [Vitis vinifera]|uniref:Post-GPI attachment to proteins factor 3 n=1 Tax=Vitis vinifera TaxID=29760 RepID=A0A438I9P4_VITVI|nr:Post-GPI attachment to proteins factor 3 [Vitis vinifera]